MKDILKEFDKRLENNGSDLNFYKEENNSFDDEYKKAMNIADDFMVLKNPLEVDFDKIKHFISDIITQTREETIREVEEGLPLEYHPDGGYENGFNSCLSEIKQSLINK